ncbi:hypothetical protein [Eudoraea adriatica]|uniref:hypothetical protein n=1 Tax=Eudoraea adriatica TaxID=446681 RepID=UPI0003A3EE91|nr:hypothetical protein [Eudoraea adriatica]
MNDIQFNKILDAVYAETANRSKGSFKRALWYGNDNMFIGQNKGLRKGIQNAPRQIFMSSLGAIPLPPFISDIFSKAVEIGIDLGQGVYKTKIKENWTGAAKVSIDNEIKNSVKDMKANAFQVIDRNLVKLKDAKNKIDPAVQAMMRTQATSQGVGGFGKNAVSSQAEGQSAHNALRAIAETQYYTVKLLLLTRLTRNNCDKMVKDLEQLELGLKKSQDDVSNYIKINM